jgi:hypothetical protein
MLPLSGMTAADRAISREQSDACGEQKLWRLR